MVDFFCSCPYVHQVYLQILSDIIKDKAISLTAVMHKLLVDYTTETAVAQLEIYNINIIFLHDKYGIISPDLLLFKLNILYLKLTQTLINPILDIICVLLSCYNKEAPDHLVKLWVNCNTTSDLNWIKNCLFSPQYNLHPVFIFFNFLYLK